MMHVILDDRTFYAYEEIEKLRTKLLKDKRSIEIKDFGAGSKIMKSNKRPIKQIAKYAATSFKKGSLLFKIVNYYKIKNILEFGTSLGIGTLYFSKANKGVKVITMEGCPNTSKIATTNFEDENMSNIEVLNSEFDQALKSIKASSFNPDLIFFDGNHTKSATLQYFERCIPYIKENAIFIFDDINWSDGMHQAWNEIRKHPKVSLSLDLFQLGILFFNKDRKEQEHFVLYF